MTARSSRLWPSAAAAALLVAACGPLGGDDNGARLHWTPSEGSTPTFALFAEAIVSIVDDCAVGNVLNACSRETVVEIVSIEVDEAILEVTPSESAVGDFFVRAVAEGETQLFIAARFDDETEAVRSADVVRAVAPVASAVLKPACAHPSASAPWLVPAGEPVPARASLVTASGAELFHHNVDWTTALLFPAGAPSGLDEATRSPAELALTFSGAGTQLVRGEGGEAVTELSLYGAADVDAVELAAPADDPAVGERVALRAVTFVDGASVCLPHDDVEVDVNIEDGTVCSFSETLTEEVQRRQPVGEGIVVFAQGPGTCRVSVSGVGLPFADELAFSVSDAPPSEE